LSLYAWYSPAAHATLQGLGADDRGRYDRVEAYICDFPKPIQGNNYVVRRTWFGREFYRYFDNVFPYAIWYDLDEDGITMVLILPAATGGTPL
jgi:hypothetical protein